MIDAVSEKSRRTALRLDQFGRFPIERHQHLAAEVTSDATLKLFYVFPTDRFADVIYRFSE